MIEAKIVADSVSAAGKRITTFVLTYPRFILAELNTHRAFSRNSASSRAIPARKIRASVRDNPGLPVFWGSNRPGMQAGEELRGIRKWMAVVVWSLSMYLMLFMNWVLEKVGLHKQISNRILEPFFTMTTVVTATEWDNFYALRNHPDAQPEIRDLAVAMLTAHNASRPQKVFVGEWHLPFVSLVEEFNLGTENAIKVSVARCARVSYMNHENKRSSLEEDLKMYERLIGRTLKHSSPAEHQATPAGHPRFQSGNLVGWTQYRKTLENETVSNYKGLKK